MLFSAWLISICVLKMEVLFANIEVTSCTYRYPCCLSHVPRSLALSCCPASNSWSPPSLVRSQRRRCSRTTPPHRQGKVHGEARKPSHRTAGTRRCHRTASPPTPGTPPLRGEIWTGPPPCTAVLLLPLLLLVSP